MRLRQAPYGIQDAVQAKLRASLDTNTIGPPAAYRHRLYLDKPFVERERVGRHLAGLHWMSDRDPFAADARAARDRLAQARGLTRQMHALRHLPAPRKPAQAQEDDRLARDTQRRLPWMSEEARRYHQLAEAVDRYPHVHDEQRVEAEGAKDAA